MLPEQIYMIKLIKRSGAITTLRIELLSLVKNRYSPTYSSSLTIVAKNDVERESFKPVREQYSTPLMAHEVRLCKCVIYVKLLSYE